MQGRVAQLVEHLTENQGVTGSSPVPATTHFRRASEARAFTPGPSREPEIMLSTQPKVIERSVPGQVTIEWADDVSSLFTAAELRQICPCAGCVSETTGKRTHDPATVSANLEQSGLKLVGNYAIDMTFSDGHNTGIFTFQFLRKLADSRG
jgi:DUF971 family protein